MASLVNRKRSQFWYVKFIDPKTGKRTFKTTKFSKSDPTETKQARALVAELAAREHRRDIHSPVERWEDWVITFLKRHCKSSRTLDRYMLAWSWLNSYLGERKIHMPSDLTYQDALGYITWRTSYRKRGGRTVKKNTALNDVKVLRVIMGEAVMSVAAKPMLPACAAMPRASARIAALPDMGLGAGGKMHQEIYEDERSLDDYDQSLTSRCFIHLCNSTAWKAITGSPPPHRPISAQLYAEHGLPWYDYYRDDLSAVEGSKELASIKTVADLYDDIEEAEFPDNESIQPKKLIQYGRRRRSQEVVEWTDEDSAV